MELVWAVLDIAAVEGLARQGMMDWDRSGSDLTVLVAAAVEWEGCLIGSTFVLKENT